MHLNSLAARFMKPPTGIGCERPRICVRQDHVGIVGERSLHPWSWKSSNATTRWGEDTQHSYLEFCTHCGQICISNLGEAAKASTGSGTFDRKESTLTFHCLVRHVGKVHHRRTVRALDENHWAMYLGALVLGRDAPGVTKQTLAADGWLPRML
jgi:hypothetical protein